MSDLNHVSVDETTQWIERHEHAYPDFHDWANSMFYLAEVRGWIQNSSTGRIRWVAEENSKAAGASAGRSGLNFLIQSMGADTGDLSLAYVFEWCLENPSFEAAIRAYVHDELLISFKGDIWLDCEATYKRYLEKGELKPVYTYGDDVREKAIAVQDLMQRAQSEVLGSGYPGLVDYHIAPFWNH